MTTNLESIQQDYTEDSKDSDIQEVGISKFQQSLPDGKESSYLLNPKSESFEADQQLSTQTSISRTEPILVNPPNNVPPLGKFISLQKWEGFVLEVTEDSFWARLMDSEEGPEEEAEFSLEEVSEGDRELVVPGAVFYWNIGYHDSPSGQRRRESLIRFRRLPAWRKEEIEKALDQAQETGERIGWQ